jgi:hypothetical protein
MNCVSSQRATTNSTATATPPVTVEEQQPIALGYSVIPAIMILLVALIIIFIKLLPYYRWRSRKPVVSYADDVVEIAYDIAPENRMRDSCDANSTTLLNSGMHSDGTLADRSTMTSSPLVGPSSLISLNSFPMTRIGRNLNRDSRDLVLNSYRSQTSIVARLGHQRGGRFSAPAAADCDRAIILVGKPPDYESLHPAGS